MAKQKKLSVERELTAEESAILEAMAGDAGADERTRGRVKALLVFVKTGDPRRASDESGISVGTIRKMVQKYNAQGWQSLISIPSPRGGDFLARYDQGFWAERIAKAYLDRSAEHRAIPYGTSRSEPFTDLQTFRHYAVNEFLLQAWSAEGRWKRPDLLLIPRDLLRKHGGTDTWDPDLRHWDNTRCGQYVDAGSAAIEVETSLWEVKRASVRLSFTVKDEDLPPLRSWVRNNRPPLYIVQVFYDQAYALPFRTLEQLIGDEAPEGRRVLAKEDRFTGKPTYNIPLDEGTLLGDIPEPDVEGRVFKAANGRVTVYGRLVGSGITTTNVQVLEQLASGLL